MHFSWKICSGSENQPRTRNHEISRLGENPWWRSRRWCRSPTSRTNWTTNTPSHQIVLADSIQNLPSNSKLSKPFVVNSKNHFRTLFSGSRGRRAELQCTSMGPAEAGPASWGVLWGHCGPSAAFARGSSNLWLQVWEADGDIYWLSWLIICPARRSGELFGGSGGLGEAVPDH